MLSIHKVCILIIINGTITVFVIYCYSPCHASLYYPHYIFGVMLKKKKKIRILILSCWKLYRLYYVILKTYQMYYVRTLVCMYLRLVMDFTFFFHSYGLMYCTLDIISLVELLHKSQRVFEWTGYQETC